MGSASGGGIFNEGTTTTITATANNGYHFTQWNDGNSDNPRTVTVTDDVTYTALFAIDQYTVTVAANDDNMGSVTGDGTYDYGTTATLTATPAMGYCFVQWSDGNNDNPRTVRVTGDTTFSAEFAINRYTVTVTANDDAMGSVTGGGVFDYRAYDTITAIANEGYIFSQWDDGNTNNPRRFRVARDTAFVAIFITDPNPTPTQYTVSVSVNDDAMGSVTGDGTYNEGDVATLTATANTGYRFVRWNDNNTDNPRSVTVTEDMDFTAYFEAIGGNTGIDDAESDGVTLLSRDGRIVVTGAEGRRVTLTDALGRILYRGTATEPLTLDAPATGVYLLQVDGHAAKRVTVVK